MSDLVVRLAGPGDLPAAMDVRRLVFVVEQAVPPDIERDGDDATADHAVALLDGRVVGTARLVSLGRVGVLGRMAVLPEARGRGVGDRLLRLIERRAAERGLTAVELHAQLHARGFYERAGYAADGPEYDEAGIPHVTMRKRLARPGDG